ncbi:caveolin-3-like isoform X2 [Apostichopus japonicus]|uniref:caveolin-3-like isoform X2 n=1 Tax=Stichopus japonicus TaxID=307972 RepID=UPI003AB2DE81
MEESSVLYSTPDAAVAGGDQYECKGINVKLLNMASRNGENTNSSSNYEEPSVSIKNNDGEVKITMTAPGEERLDMQDRDPTNMNSHVRVGFEEVFAEPEGMHSWDPVWRYSYLTFFNSKFWCYRLITLLCAVPAAILWGIYFALLTFTHIWCVVPCVKAILIKLQCAGQLFGLLVRTFWEPLYIALSKIFSNIHITIRKE